jgi:metal-responsive CopG/Arc/MetJ family transcriptional regulator
VDAALLRATDRAARAQKVNRSALVRDALRTYLRLRAVSDRERRDREGCLNSPDTEFGFWEKAAAWPE